MNNGNNDNKNDLYYDDNSFNENGIDAGVENNSPQFPTANRGNSVTNFGKGLVEGVKNGLDKKKNNPALGVNVAKKDDPMKGQKKPDKKGSKPSDDKNNPAKGQKDGDKKKNPLPGGMNKDKNDNNKNANRQKPQDKNNERDKNKEKGKNKGFGSKLNPFNRGGIGSKLGLGKKKDSKDEGVVGPNLNEVATKGIKAAWTLAPIQVKVAVIVLSVVPIIILVLIVFLAIFGGTTAAVTAAMCGNTDYDVNGADATAFLCSMSSPFGENGYSVTGTSGWRIHPKYNTLKFHYGTDVVVSGSDLSIYAVQSGTIEEIKYNGGWGNTILINHGNFYTRYAHLSKFESGLKKGDKVEKGQKIGTEGSTGVSTGPHLHFEFRDANGNYLSANPFFGYSDQGYEKCIDPDNKTTDTKCNFDSSGDARKIGEEGFAQICGKTGSYSMDSSDCCGETPAGTTDDFISFLNKFEGAGKSCSTKSGKIGYLAENLGDGAITAGHGVTNAPVKSSAGQSLIVSSGYKSDFTLKNGKYVMVVGGCYPQSVINDIQKISIENDYGYAVYNSAQRYGVSLTQYEKDALTSFNYNLGSGHIDELIDAYKNDSYEGLWNKMKGYVHSDGKVLEGLQKRRKAEFALFVTGDYTDQNLFYSRNVTDYDNYDSENVMARKGNGTASVCSTSGGSGDIVERANQEYEKWNNSSQSERSELVKNYMEVCGLGRTCNDWCAGFVSYILKETGKLENLKGYNCYALSYKDVKPAEHHEQGSGYTPQPGDVIVFGYGHVAFVESVEGKTLHYIGGNQTGSNRSTCWTNAITKNTVPVDSGKIAEFVTIG